MVFDFLVFVYSFITVSDTEFCKSQSTEEEEKEGEAFDQSLKEQFQ